MRLPCGIEGDDCSSCPYTECIATTSQLCGKKKKYDAMSKVSILYDCYSDIEQHLTVEPDSSDDYFWPWPLQPNELKSYLEDLADKVCTEKQAEIIRLRLRWDKHRAVPLTFKEIGIALGISKQAASEQYKAAVIRLNKALQGEPLWEDFQDDLDEIIKRIGSNGGGDGRQ